MLSREYFHLRFTLVAFLSYEYDEWCFFVMWIWWVMTHLHAYMQMPTTIEELEAAIQDTLSQANSTLSLNQNVVEEYEHRQGKVMLESWDYLFFISFIVLALKLHLPLQALQIEAITKKLEADKEELKKCLAEIDALKVRDVSLLCHITGIYIYITVILLDCISEILGLSTATNHVCRMWLRFK